MLPFIFDWHWTIDRVIFMGYFWLALTIIGLGMTVAVLLTLRDLFLGGGMHHGEHADAEGGH